MDDILTEHNTDKYTGAQIGENLGPYDQSIFLINCKTKQSFSRLFCEKYKGKVGPEVRREIEDTREELIEGFKYVKAVEDCSSFNHSVEFAERRKDQLIRYLNKVEEYTSGEDSKDIISLITNFYFFARVDDNLKITWLPGKDILTSQSIENYKTLLYPTLSEEVLVNGDEDNIVIESINEWNDADYRKDLKDAAIGHAQEIAKKDRRTGVYHDIFFDPVTDRARLSDLVHFNRGVFQTPVTHNDEDKEVGYLFICSPIDFEALFSDDVDCSDFMSEIIEESLDSGGKREIYYQIRNSYVKTVSFLTRIHEDEKINSAIDLFGKLKNRAEKEARATRLGEPDAEEVAEVMHHDILGRESHLSDIRDWMDMPEEVKDIESSAKSLFMFSKHFPDDVYSTPDGRNLEGTVAKYLLEKLLENAETDLENFEVDDSPIQVPAIPFLSFFLSLKNLIISLEREGNAPNLCKLSSTTQDLGVYSLDVYHLRIELDRSGGDPWELANKYHDLTSGDEEGRLVSGCLNNLRQCALGNEFLLPRKNTKDHQKFFIDGFSRRVINIDFPSAHQVILSWSTKLYNP
jgi:hypothetical protein